MRKNSNVRNELTLLLNIEKRQREKKIIIKMAQKVLVPFFLDETKKTSEQNISKWQKHIQVLRQNINKMGIMLLTRRFN